MANNRAASCHCRSLNWLPLRNVLVRCVNVFLQWGQRNRCLRRASFPNRNAPAAPQCRQKILCAAIFVEGSFSRSHFYSLPSTQMGSTAQMVQDSEESDDSEESEEPFLQRQILSSESSVS